jgi:hypothetical protein
MRCETIAVSSKCRGARTGFARFGVLAGVIATLALSAAAGAELPENTADLKDGLRSAERAIAGRFDALPMRMIGRVRGGRLEDFGVVFFFEVNVVPMASVSPFRPAYSEDELKSLNEKKRAGVEQLEKIGLDLLAETAGSLGAIPLDEHVALVIELFHFTWEDAAGLPSQLVLQARRSLLLDRAAGRVSEAELVAQVKIRRF